MTYAQGSPINVLTGSIYLLPSGDTTGATDFARLKAAIATATTSGATIFLAPGHYYATAPYTVGTAFDYIFLLPASTLAAPTNLKIVGLGSGGATGMVTSAPSGGLTGSAGQVIIDCSGCVPPTQTSVRAAAFAPDSGTSALGLTVTFENFSLIVPSGTTTQDSSGCEFGAIGGQNLRDFTVTTPFTVAPTSGKNGEGIAWSGAGNDNTWSNNVNIGGFRTGASFDGAWNAIGSLNIEGCYLAVSWANSEVDAGEMAHIDFLNIAECSYSMGVQTASYPARFFVGSYNNYYITGNANFPFVADWLDPNNLLAGLIVSSNVINGTSGAYVATIPATAGTAIGLIIQAQATPTGISSSFYPRLVLTTGPGGAVALQTGSTSILTTGTTIPTSLYTVIVNMTHVTGTVAGTLTVTYTDNTTGATATQSYTIASGAPGVSVTATFLCNAKTGTAIAVAGTSATNNDIQATCTIYNAL